MSPGSTVSRNITPELGAIKIGTNIIKILLKNHIPPTNPNGMVRYTYTLDVIQRDTNKRVRIPFTVFARGIV